MKKSDSKQNQGSEIGDNEYLEDMPDGCGCTEIWERLSEQRTAETGDD